jgi:hypothetical protein
MPPVREPAGAVVFTGRIHDLRSSFMPSVRAEAVAEVLWELKRAEKLATWSNVAGRAGFKAGVNGKNLLTCLEAVRRDWPHLQWWRVIPDSVQLAEDCEQVTHLRTAGIPLGAVEGRTAVVQVIECETHFISWEEAPVVA